MLVSEFKNLTESDVTKLLKTKLTKIECQQLFLYMTQVPLLDYHKKLVDKIMKIVPIYSYEVKNLMMDDSYLKCFVYKKEVQKRELLEPAFSEKKVKKRNDETKKIRRENKAGAKIKAEKIVSDKKEYKGKIEEMYKKIKKNN